MYHLEEHFGALLSRPLLDPGGDVERRLADLAAADVDLRGCDSIGIIFHPRINPEPVPGHVDVSSSHILT